MMSAGVLFTVGFALGLRHALDADHVVAVSTIVTRERSVRAAVWLGLLWGVGHGVTVTGIGAMLLVFGWMIPPQVSAALEGAVGIMLIALGVWALLGLRMRMPWLPSTQANPARAAHAARPHTSDRARSYTPRGPTQALRSGFARTVAHAHAHAHGDFVHSHAHDHAAGVHGHSSERLPTVRMDARFGHSRAYRTLRPLLIGVMHGLAGSAAVALLVLSAARDTWQAVGFLLSFACGTLLSMVCLTLLISMPLAVASKRSPRFALRLQWVAGVAGIVLGVLIVAQWHLGGGVLSSVWSMGR